MPNKEKLYILAINDEDADAWSLPGSTGVIVPEDELGPFIATLREEYGDDFHYVQYELVEVDHG